MTSEHAFKSCRESPTDGAAFDAVSVACSGCHRCDVTMVLPRSPDRHSCRLSEQEEEKLRRLLPRRVPYSVNVCLELAEQPAQFRT